MATNYIRFEKEKKIDWAKWENGKLFPLLAGDLNTKEFLEFVKTKPKISESSKLSLEEVSLLSPITAPCQIICQGANYEQHLIESGLNPKEKKYNLFFTKSDASLSPPVGEVIRPNHVRLLDYEIELGLVFGKPINQSLESNSFKLSDYVSALFMANDISARDIQLPQMQWYKGKSYRSFLPAGPILAVLEEGDVSLLENLELTLLVNDRIRQHDSIAGLVYKPEETIQELSQFCDIMPGDVLLTGTPSGCALRAPGKLVQKIAALLSEKRKWELFIKGQLKRTEYLQPGDTIRSSIRTADRRIDLGDQILKVVQEK
ncbi:fumarylacetoacetate hydrolase family protein [Leptospira montravelensis]|uniref:Fumarylacetoacetate hydrolase family protein n=1 Tax=Leptospira montravelensis TaxID=2484961 RepID=A0ABY2LP68_9LEPT|nr:fumarylacetoacetate hydrolase family protein [Leptospira montravelensis]TGK80982.1 fumarylacetoacetate hydrolase family protein [Leptospira montravelensis]TGL01423.1 fumarylacetoacetate hydrolase family protein [Leptospira montravelensis]